MEDGASKTGRLTGRQGRQTGAQADRHAAGRENKREKVEGSNGTLVSQRGWQGGRLVENDLRVQGAGHALLG